MPENTIERREEVRGTEKTKQADLSIFTGNAKGSEDLEALFIGRTATPVAFLQTASVGEKRRNLPAAYRHNSTAWMSSAIYYQHLGVLNLKMASQGRRIVLITLSRGERLKRRNVAFTLLWGCGG